MLAAEGIVLIRRNRRERSRTAHARLGLHFAGSMEHEKALRQTTLFSMVSSNWGDSLGREHLTSDI
jgi:hypothetical protein